MAKISNITFFNADFLHNADYFRNFALDINNSYIINKQNIMKKVTDFLDSLTPLTFEMLGNPTIKFYDEFIEVQFSSRATFRNLELFDLNGFDEFRFFPLDDSIVFVWTFYKNND